CNHTLSALAGHLAGHLAGLMLSRSNNISYHFGIKELIYCIFIDILALNAL
ncbi:MAG: hypothetical protein JWM16_2801, partial [Verrucomicrobiales bacterium]|nr:hypothetical protein [Verrucomicrobiales bacterium]